jgi:ribosomal protein L7/L12
MLRFATPGQLAPPEIEAAIQQGNKIEAIRLLRAQTGVGLKAFKRVLALVVAAVLVAYFLFKPA